MPISSNPPPTARRQRLTPRQRFLAAAITVLLTIVGLGAQVGAAPAAQAADQSQRLGTVLTHQYGQSRATIAMDECGEISMNTDGGRGTRGSCVASLQHWLNVFNGANISVDGSFGPGTRQAVIDYQLSRGLPPSGAVFTQTREQLAWDYNNHFGIRFVQNYPGDYNPYFVLDVGNINGTLYLSRGKSVEIARMIADNPGALAVGGASGIAATCGPIASLGVAAAACAALWSTLALYPDMANKVLKDPNGCFAMQRPFALTNFQKVSNPVFCQVPAI